MKYAIKTRKQMADEFGVSERTFRRYLKKYSIELPSGNILPKYQRLIYDTLGNPQQGTSPNTTGFDRF